MQLSTSNLKREPTKAKAEIDTIISLSKVAISYWQLFLFLYLSFNKMIPDLKKHRLAAQNSFCS